MQPVEAYLNKQYASLPLEEWKVIDDSDDFYEISNLGRVRSNDRHIFTKDGRTVFLKGKILSQSIMRYKNNYTNDYIIELVCAYRKDGKQYSFSVSRMVFNTFINKINYEIDRQLVLHIDGNKFNTSASNLYLANRSAVCSKMYKQKRSVLRHTLITSQAKEKGITRRQKEISQYFLDGNLIAHFSSIKEGSKKTGVGSSAIIAAAKGIKMVSAGGYLWKYGLGPSKICTNYYNIFIEKSKQNNLTPVIQVNIDGKFITTFGSIKEASESTKISSASLSGCINKKTKTAGGYKWYKNILQIS